MSTTTTNLGLVKPQLTDAADITTMNSNWDKIDANIVYKLNQIAVYYGGDSNKSADDLIDAFALIPINSSLNGDLFNIVGGTFAYVITLFYGNATLESRRMQLAFSYNGGQARMAHRIYTTSGWLAWKKIVDANDLSKAVSKSGDTMTGALRIKNGDNAPNGIRLNSQESTGAVLIDQVDIANDDSDRSGIKIMHNSNTLGDLAQVFRTVDGTTNWYSLYGKHNAFLGYKLYSSLSDIGLSSGSETISGIATSLPDYSVLILGITTNNASIYPSNYGLLTVKRAFSSRIEFRFVNTNGVEYTGFYTINSGGDVWTGWKMTYDENQITYGTTDLTAGTSALATGKLHFVYE